MVQGMNATSKSLKGQGNGFFLETLQKEPALLIP
jgi:hypothetical protein